MSVGERLGLEKAAGSEAERARNPVMQAGNHDRSLRRLNNSVIGTSGEAHRKVGIAFNQGTVSLRHGPLPVCQNYSNPALTQALSHDLARQDRADIPVRQLAEIVLCTQGTRGDLAPFLGLAAHLIAAGRKVTVMANENWQPLIAGVGADFLSVGPADPTQTGRDDRAFFSNAVVPSFQRSFDLIAALVSTGRRPTLLFRSTMAGVAAAAEAFNLTAGAVFLQPSAVSSCLRPPWPLTPLAQGPWRTISRYTLLPTASCLSRWLNPFKRATDRFRRSVGLRALPPLTSPPADFSLMLCPDWFALPQLDWPAACYVTGFVLPPRELTVHDSINTFIACHGAPLVFTPGTGVSEVDGFVTRAYATAGALGLPAIILTPHGTPGTALRETILMAPFADLGAILPRARAIIHHGGIGTIAQAIHAGIPQLIVASRFDQPDNAIRVATLGLGGAILRHAPTTDDWIASLREVLASRHVAQQVATAACLVARTNAAAISASVIAEHETRRSGIIAGAAEAGGGRTGQSA